MSSVVCPPSLAEGTTALMKVGIKELPAPPALLYILAF